MVGIILIGILILFLWIIVSLASQSTTTRTRRIFTPRFTSSPTLTGVQGELRVERKLARLDSNNYKVLNDVLLQHNNKTIQIDHVVLSIYGIFVIETKNYTGWIFGNEKDNKWTQSIYNLRYKTTEKYQFYNPIRQNWSHMYALKKALKDTLPDISENAYHPIVVFTGDAELKQITADHPVVYIEELLDTISDLSSTHYFDSDTVEKIYQRIVACRATKQAVKEAHIHEVQTHARERTSLICPQCKGCLRRRNGAHGPFYGCANYPDCAFILNIRYRHRRSAEQHTDAEEQEILICPQCDGELKRRNSQYGHFYGCSGYPDCEFTIKER